jgi:hypothetical protein
MAFYYQRLNAPKGLVGGYRALLDVLDAYAVRASTVVIPASGPARTAALAQRALLRDKGEQVRKLVEWMFAEYEALEVNGALEADRMIRTFIRQTAVRPPTSGTLEQGIKSRPLSTQVPVGAIGVADLDHLDATVINPRYKRFGPYWRAQEYGLPAVSPSAYGGNGRKVAPGYFQPGNAKPAQSEFRVHPYFVQERYSRGMPALMRLRAVPARHFLEKGTDAFITWRQGEIARINRHAVSTLASI